ncbi:MAG TPA: hypothetical protein PK195_09415 [Ignavibacteriaceae bacterium]|nr:hypothetical protein [Ignavibacteriaceae bacterium]
MNEDNFNLPQRKVLEPEILSNEQSINNGGKYKFTEKQMDTIVDAAAKSAPDIINVVKDVVAIIKIREQADADVKTIEARTQQYVKQLQKDIEKIKEEGEKIKTQGEVVVRVLSQLSNIVNNIPDSDALSRHRLIDQLSDIIEMSVKNGS